MKAILIMVILILSSGIAHAEDLSDFPEMFIDDGNFDGYIVVGNKAPASYVIAQSKLVSFFGAISAQPVVGKTKLATDLETLESNLIFIGSPCENELLSLMEDYPLECSWIASRPGLHYTEFMGRHHIIISGDNSDIQQGVEILINYEDHDMMGPQVFLEEAEEPVLQESIEDTEQGEELNKTAVMDELTRKIAEKTAEANIEEKLEIIEEKAENAAAAVQEINEKAAEKGFFTKILEWIKSIFD